MLVRLPYLGAPGRNFADRESAGFGKGPASGEGCGRNRSDGKRGNLTDY